MKCDGFGFQQGVNPAQYPALSLPQYPTLASAHYPTPFHLLSHTTSDYYHSPACYSFPALAFYPAPAIIPPQVLIPHCIQLLIPSSHLWATTISVTSPATPIFPTFPDLVLLEDAVDHQGRLLVHTFSHSVSHGVVGLEPPRQCLRHPILVIHVLLGVPAQKTGIMCHGTPGNGIRVGMKRGKYGGREYGGK